MSGFSDLVGGGADKGPGNGLNGLVKQFNKDHSLEQATSSSKQAFRQAFRQNGPIASPGAATPADYMALANKPQQQQGPGSFNFAEMHRELGGALANSSAPQVDWSADFARHQAARTGAGGGGGHAEFEHAFARAGTGPMMHMHPMARQQANWAEQFHQPARQAASLAPPASVAATTVPMRPDPMAMAFNEARMYSMLPGPGMMMPQMMPQQWQQQQQQVGGTAEQSSLNATAQASDLPDTLSTNDDLADTASQILESVRNSANPKFKNSEFFSFMHQLADRQATISGDQIVTEQKGKQAEPQALSAASGPTWATEFEKRADELVNREAAAATAVSEQTPQDGKIFSEEFARGLERNWAEEFEQTLSGPLKESTVSGHPQEMDATLDQPSSQFIHSEAQQDWVEQFKDKIQPMLSEQDREWLDTQKEWEKLSSAEAAHRAVDPELNIYRFQADNYYAQMPPDALREAVQHMRQSPESASLGDTILALESAVMQSPQDAQAWLQLGLKQQENEQEQAAIAALRKAISLDASSLDAHLALAVSYTNEGYQMDAYDELHEWVSRHDRYKAL
ncbi:hypothetical protein GGF38_002799, partial [Coemansia sp. RSA 25]